MQNVLITLCISIFLIANSIYSQGLLSKNINQYLSTKNHFLEVDYLTEVYQNFNSKGHQNPALLHFLQPKLSLDLNNLVGMPNSQLFTSIISNFCKVPNDDICSIQGISNIAAHNTTKLYELQLRTEFNNFSLLFGLYDLNSEFDTRESSSLFINPSHGIGPDFSLSGKNGPSIFPSTALSMRVKLDFENLSVKTAIIDGVAGNPDNPNGTQVVLDKNDGYLLTTEIDYTDGEFGNNSFFSYKLGGWFYTENFEVHGKSKNKEKSFGMYLSMEKLLYGDKANSNLLVGFLRVGYANPNVNVVKNYFGFGINLLKPFASETEELGLAASITNNSNKYISNLDNECNKELTEYIIEFTYKNKILDYLFVQPDLQYVINPAYSTKKSILVVGMRLGLLL